MNHFDRCFLLALAMACAIPCGSALAVSPEDRAAADQLFNDGRAAVKAGDFETGCKKLASSQVLDPAIGTLLALGDCYELAGQTASAWATFGDAAAMAQKAGDQAREDEGNRRAGLLAPKLSKLVIEIPKSELTEDTKVVRNGKAVPVASLGSAIPVDPGLQTVEVTIPGKKPWRGDIQVPATPGAVTLTVPQLERAERPPKPGGGAVPPTSRSGSGQRIAGIVVGSVGLVGLGLGVGFGAATIAKVGDISDQKLCDASDPPKCTQAGVDAQADANTLANVSNVGFAVGGAALVAGIIVFATAPRSGDPAEEAIALRVAAGPGGARIALGGAF